MPVPEKEARILFQKSGNRCAMPGCGTPLTFAEGNSNSEISVSDIAHIIAESEDGPRGRHHLTLEERSKVGNLILLCKECHRKIDMLVPTYPVERLRGIKEDHERRIAQATEQAILRPIETPAYETEQLFSTLLPVTRMPRHVYSAPITKRGEEDIKQAIRRPKDAALVYPFILRENRLYCFNLPGSSENPFLDAVDSSKWRTERSDTWWNDEDRLRSFQDLLGRSLNKLTGRKGLMLDREHRRYYFTPCGEPDKPLPRKVAYTPLNKKHSERSVVWQPTRKTTGEARPYWYHLAVSLTFRHVGRRSWALCVRPELRVTRDGVTSLAARDVGGKVTKKKAHAFNNDLLEDLQFWRWFLADGKPRIALWFGGGQQIIVSSSMIEASINWPGMPDEYKLPFQNVDFDDNLFSAAERAALDDEFDDNDDDYKDDDETEE